MTGRKPLNILFFFPDQHRPDWLGDNADLPLKTPNLDLLMASGVTFRRTYCTSPLCAPSRASLASGREYAECGVVNNNQDYPLELPTYYQALRDVGYRVGGVGKFDLHKNFADLNWHLDGSRLLREWGFTDGIDNEGKFDGSISYQRHGGPRGPYLKFLADRGLADVYVQEHADIKHTMGAYTTALPDDAYCDNWLSENGLQILREFPKGQPWHLVVNFTGPHNPMDVTAEMRSRWDSVPFPMPHNNDHPDREGLLRNRQNYAAMIENIDRQVGRFLDAVAARGEQDRTLVIYASDHGEMLGDHGRWGKGIWYEPSVRVPLILCGPGVAAGDVCDELVSLIDVTATILEAAGAPALPQMDGKSLLQLAAGDKHPHREHVVAGLNDWRMACDQRFKLVTDGPHQPQLFDRVNDPWEDQNVAADHPRVVARLQAALN